MQLLKELPDKIPILDQASAQVGHLKRLVSLNDISDELVTCMVDWRNKFGSFFITQFNATQARTEKWLKEVIIPDKTRAMYLIEDNAGNWFGHVGVKHLNTNCPELDNMIRGRSGMNPQAMLLAEVALLSAIFENASVNAVCLEVFSRNLIALSLHQSIGFEICNSRLVVGRVYNNEVHYTSAPQNGESEGLKMLSMRVTRIGFQSTLSSMYKC